MTPPQTDLSPEQIADHLSTVWILNHTGDTGYLSQAEQAALTAFQNSGLSFVKYAENLISQAITKHSELLEGRVRELREKLMQVVEAFDQEKLVAHGEISDAFNVDGLMTEIVQLYHDTCCPSDSPAKYSLACAKCGHEGFGCYSDHAQMLRDAVKQNWVLGEFGEFTCPDCICAALSTPTPSPSKDSEILKGSNSTQLEFLKDSVVDAAVALYHAHNSMIQIQEQGGSIHPNLAAEGWEAFIQAVEEYKKGQEP